MAAAFFLTGLLVADFLYLRWALFGDSPPADTHWVVGGFLVLINVLIGASAAQAIGAVRKGHLSFEVADRPYTWGEEIAGSLVIHSRRRLDLERATVLLRAQRVVPHKEHTRRETVFETAVDVAKAESIAVGEHRYAFRLRFPPLPPPEPADVANARLVESAGMWGGLLRTSPSHANLRWQLAAAVLVPGVDLWEEQELRFNDQTLGTPLDAFAKPPQAG